MSWNVNPPRAGVGDPYCCVIENTDGYKEIDGPKIDTTRRTMEFKYLHTGGSGSYDWNLGVPRVNGPDNDDWEFIFMVSFDGGRTFRESSRKKPVMMSTSGGGGYFTKPYPYKTKRTFWNNLFFWR